MCRAAASSIRPGLDDADIIAVWQIAGQSCVQVFFMRGGRNNGNRAHFPSHAKGDEPADVLAAFIAQFYDDKPPPPLILVNHELPEPELVAGRADAESRPRAWRSPCPQRGEKCAVVQHAETNAREALERKLAESAGQTKLLEGVASLFDLPATPERIETYDNSHIMGTERLRRDGRRRRRRLPQERLPKIHIRGPITPGDDFAMMREVLERRFARAQKEQQEGAPAADWPDMVLIDGGAGQYSAARAVLDDLGVTDVMLVAIAKGPDRDAGREWFHTAGRAPFQLPPRDPVLYYLQRLRDEAHRFAITTHRAGRSKALVTSELDEIDGIGSARKRALLNHFGRARGVKQAGLEDLQAAPGISNANAAKIYAHFHAK